jgi:hypothetical protein
MENFEEEALKRATHKPLFWFRYVDDTFAIWPHGWKKLDDFHRLLNSVHNNIQFTMETETVGHIPFLNIDVCRKRDGSLGHRVYRKPTHINLYLNATSHLHPDNKQAVLSTFLHRAEAGCDTDSLPK